jgi:hypothetical protein
MATNSLPRHVPVAVRSSVARRYASCAFLRGFSRPACESSSANVLFRRTLRTVKEYGETVAYIHQNPVRAGLVERAEDWPWSSVREYSGTLRSAEHDHPVLRINRVLLPAEERTRL